MCQEYALSGLKLGTSLYYASQNKVTLGTSQKPQNGPESISKNSLAKMVLLGTEPGTFVFSTHSVNRR